MSETGAGQLPGDAGTVVLPLQLPVVVPDVNAQPVVEQVVEQVAPPVVHRVELREVGPFTTASCTGCDWRSFARRSRPLARSEGEDHARLYAPSPMGQGS